MEKIKIVGYDDIQIKTVSREDNYDYDKQYIDDANKLFKFLSGNIPSATYNELVKLMMNELLSR